LSYWWSEVILHRWCPPLLLHLLGSLYCGLGGHQDQVIALDASIPYPLTVIAKQPTIVKEYLLVNIDIRLSAYHDLDVLHYSIIFELEGNHIIVLCQLNR